MTEAFPFPLPPRPLLPRLIAGNNRGRPGSQPMEVKVVSLTGTGRGGRTCHPASVDRPSRPLSSAVQPSFPPLPSPPHSWRPNRQPGLARPAPHPAPLWSGAWTCRGRWGPPEVGGRELSGLRTRKGRDSQGPAGITFSKGGN